MQGSRFSINCLSDLKKTATISVFKRMLKDFLLDQHVYSMKNIGVVGLIFEWYVLGPNHVHDWALAITEIFIRLFMFLIVLKENKGLLLLLCYT